MTFMTYLWNNTSLPLKNLNYLILKRPVLNNDLNLKLEVQGLVDSFILLKRNLVSYTRVENREFCIFKKLLSQKITNLVCAFLSFLFVLFFEHIHFNKQTSKNYINNIRKKILCKKTNMTSPLKKEKKKTNKKRRKSTDICRHIRTNQPTRPTIFPPNHAPFYFAMFRKKGPHLWKYFSHFLRWFSLIFSWAS